MPKYWSYDVGEKVQINANALNDLPSCVGLQGVIVEQLNGVRWDYELILENGTLARVIENEINIVKE
jgi:hypothetical protein